MKTETQDYSEYTVRISDEPCYYGSDCTEEDAERIFKNLKALIQSEFPGVNIESWREGQGSTSICGPDVDESDRIYRWISANWTAAL